MNTKSELICSLQTECCYRELNIPGHHNDDCVNLAILAWMEYGEVRSAVELETNVYKVADEYRLTVSMDGEDREYLRDKCLVLIGYLPSWGPHPDEDEAIRYVIE